MYAGRICRDCLLPAAVAMSLFVIFGIAAQSPFGVVTEPWDSVLIVAAGVLWIAFVVSDVRVAISTQIARRLDVLADELTELQSYDTATLLAEIESIDSKHATTKQQIFYSAEQEAAKEG